jgi:hypothetical protein
MSKYSTLLIPILNEILIGEIGEANILPLKWERNNGGHYSFDVDINNINEIVEVEFEPMWVDSTYKQFYLPTKLWDSKNTWNIAYTIGGTDTQFAKTNLKLLLQILSTVVDIVKDFISNKEPDALYIHPTEKDPSKNQKKHLYEAYLKNLLSQIPNYYPESRRGGTLLIKK